MDIYVMNENMDRIGIIDYCKSIIWTKRYYDIGEFELYLPAGKEACEILKKENMICRDNDNTVMVIRKVEIKTSEEDGDYLIVSGQSAETYLNYRIVWKQTILEESVCEGIIKIIEENIINPEDSDRKIDCIEIGECIENSEKIKKQLTGEFVGDAVAELCKTYGIGFRMDFDRRKKKFIFQLYEGKDHSYSQKELPYVLFSEEYDNLKESDYQCDISNYRNVALVAGEGEGTERRTCSIGTGAGLQRKEVYIEASGVSSNDKKISSDVYYSMLAENGAEKLKEYSETETFDGSVESSANHEYGKDYFLGDIVEIRNKYNLGTRARITEVIENYDETGMKIVPTFTNMEVL